MQHAGAAPALPVTTTESYSLYLAPSKVTETVGVASRTNTTTFDAAGRQRLASTVVTGVPGSTPVPTTRTDYSATTGDVTATVSVSVSGAELGWISHTCDLWGRQVTYTDSDGQVTTTAYDAAGRVGSVTDPTGSVTFAYDGATERRGLVTS